MKQETIEQAEPEVESTNDSDSTGEQDSIDSILGDALKGKDGTPEDSEPTGEGEPEGQPKQFGGKKEAVEEAEELFGELMLDEAKKLPFKTEQEFQGFLERNPLLKDGFLRQSDYTKKTTQLSQERKQLEEKLSEFEKESEAWGGNKPNEQSKQFFYDVWSLFNHGSEPLAQKISEFANDISLIKAGRQPVGPLAGNDGESVDFSRDSQIVEVRRELDQLRRERERDKSEGEKQSMTRHQEEANREVGAWLKEKESAGNPITMDERKAMARFSGLRDDDGNRISLEEMHRLALAYLGKTEKTAIKKVFKSATERSGKTGMKPASRISSGERAEVDIDNLDDILNEGLDSIKE